MSLPNLLNTNHLRTLSLGINTSRFLEYLIPCIAFIENLSVGVKDIEINEYDWFKINSLPVAVDPDLLLYLSRLHIDCKNSITCRRTIALLSSVFGQLRHLSLKLVAYISIYNPLIISAYVEIKTRTQLSILYLNPFLTTSVIPKTAISYALKVRKNASRSFHFVAVHFAYYPK